MPKRQEGMEVVCFFFFKASMIVRTVRLVEVRQKPLLEKNTINQCCFSYVVVKGLGSAFGLLGKGLELAFRSML